MTKHNEGLSVVGRGRGSIGSVLTGVSTGRGRGVDSLTRVGNLGDVSVGVVGGVGDGLNPAVGEGDRVGATDVSAGIAGLSGVEVSLGVVIGNTVGVGVRLRELLHHLDNRGSVVGGGGSVGRGSMHHMVDGSGVDSVDKRSVHCVVSVADAVSDMGDMVDLGTGQTEEGGDHEGLKFGH